MDLHLTCAQKLITALSLQVATVPSVVSKYIIDGSAIGYRKGGHSFFSKVDRHNIFLVQSAVKFRPGLKFDQVLSEYRSTDKFVRNLPFILPPCYQKVKHTYV